MNDTRRARIWSLVGTVMLALTIGAASKRARRDAGTSAAFAPGEELRDAAASPPTPATAGLGGKPVPTSWFQAPEKRRVEMDAALLSSRRRRGSGPREARQ